MIIDGPRILLDKTDAVCVHALATLLDYIGAFEEGADPVSACQRTKGMPTCSV